MRLFCFGLGYTALRLACLLVAEGWAVAGTRRAEATWDTHAIQGIALVPFDRDHSPADADAVLAGATHLLSSVPPDARGDPVLDAWAAAIVRCRTVRWVGYLSTTGVYGDSGGAVVDEDSPTVPTVPRSVRRLAAERAWLDLHARHGVPVHVFRLAGIYGPGRSALDQVRAGAARRIDRPGHLFSRIHVDDIVAVLCASMATPRPGAIYNVCDDEPATPADVIEHACRLLGVPPPPMAPFAEAASGMSPMALSFWRDNRRVANRRIKAELGVRLRYPDFRAGLAAVLAEEKP